MDLVTEPSTKNLIRKAINTKKCENKDCSSKFDFKNIRFYCSQSQKFFCKKCVSSEKWVYEKWQSSEPQRPVCRSKPVAAQIAKHEKEIREAMQSHQFEQVDHALKRSEQIDIDCRLKHEAEVLHKKLGQELKINSFLESKHHHDNYKDIRKDVEKINNYIKEAEEENIELDQDIVAKVNKFASRLISERNLRKQRDLYLDSISSCNPGQVEKLQNLIDDATQKNVETEYIQNA